MVPPWPPVVNAQPHLPCRSPALSQAFNHLLSAKARHGAELDWGAIYLAVRDAAGLPPNTKQPSA